MKVTCIKEDCINARKQRDELLEALKGIQPKIDTWLTYPQSSPNYKWAMQAETALNNCK